MADERMRILDMVREGKITADEAVRLLEAMKGSGDAGEANAAGTGGGEGQRGAEGERGRGIDDAVGHFVDAVTDAVSGRGWRGFGGRGGGFGPWGGRGWGGFGNWSGPGRWEGPGGWHGGWHGGWLRGQERRSQRESDGWQISAFADGDRGGFDVPEGAKLRVESEAGAIEVKAADGPARLDLEGDDFFNFATYVARKGDEVIVAAYRTSQHARMPRLVVSVPRAIARLGVETAGGNVDASGFGCPVSLRTAGGSVRVRGQGSGALKVRTAGGGVDVEGTPESLEAHTAGGSIRFKGQTNSLDAKTAGGSITVDGVHLTSGAHRAKTAGGSVNLRLTRDSSVAIEAATGAGSINVNLPGAEGQLSGSRIAPRYQGQFNGRGATLELRTVGGSINLALADEPATVAA